MKKEGFLQKHPVFFAIWTVGVVIWAFCLIPSLAVCSAIEKVSDELR